MNKDLKKAMNLLRQEIKYAKTSESDSLTGIIARFNELETVVKNCSIPNVSVRDFFAANALKAEIESWNAEMSDEYRAKLLEDMIERHGETTVYEALAKNAFEMADAMLHAR